MDSEANILCVCTGGLKSTSRRELKAFRLKLRKVLDLESVNYADGNVIREGALPIWANFRQRALDVAIMEINKKTDLRTKLSSMERWNDENLGE